MIAASSVNWSIRVLLECPSYLQFEVATMMSFITAVYNGVNDISSMLVPPLCCRLYLQHAELFISIRFITKHRAMNSMFARLNIKRKKLAPNTPL